MYVDGFVVPVPSDRKQDYIRFAREAAEVFRGYGATAVIECWADDVPVGELTSFPRAVHLQEGETCVFAWVTYPDRATRDACVQKTAADPRMQTDPGAWPFDGKRMIFGGFEAVVVA